MKAPVSKRSLSLRTAHHVVTLGRKCSLLSIASILQALEYHPHSVGYLSQDFHSAGQTLPSTLVIPSKTLVFYLSDEIFAIPAPILVTIDARNTTILNIELASDRSADTWRAHFEALEHHHFFSLGLASDRVWASLPVTGLRATWPCGWRIISSQFVTSVKVLHQLERKAYATIGKEDAAVQVCACQSESISPKRLQQDETAHHACEQAMALYDQQAMLLHLPPSHSNYVRPHGRLRTQQDVRSG